MTESDWDTAADPSPMLKALSGKASERKLRLFAVACCRRHWHLMTDERSRAAVELGERLADGLGTETERQVAEAQAVQATRTAVQARGEDFTISESFTIAARAARFTVMEAGTFDLEAALATASACRLMVLHESGSRDGRASENAALCSTLRDVFGNPFRPTTIDNRILTPHVLATAKSIYDDRAFHHVFAVADALTDAGAPDDSPLLQHLRGRGPHVRGCYALDLVLGKI